MLKRALENSRLDDVVAAAAAAAGNKEAVFFSYRLGQHSPTIFRRTANAIAEIESHNHSPVLFIGHSCPCVHKECTPTLSRGSDFHSTFLLVRCRDELWLQTLHTRDSCCSECWFRTHGYKWCMRDMLAMDSAELLCSGSHTQVGRLMRSVSCSALLPTKSIEIPRQRARAATVLW
jgi:hypothetical protein